MSLLVPLCKDSLNTINESEDDGYITYTAKGTAEQTLTLLIDKDIVVENI